MPIDDLKNIIGKRSFPARLMALDVGEKTIGVAISDREQTLSTPLRTVKRTKFSEDIKALKALIREYEIHGFIIGWPVNMDGSRGPQCDRVRSFADEMARSLSERFEDPWIALWDERLSTETVHNLLDQSGDSFKNLRKSKSGGKKRAKVKGVTDMLAAHVILQGALEFINGNSSHHGL